MMGIIDTSIILVTMAIAFSLGRITRKSKVAEVTTTPENPKHTIFSPQITVVFQQDIDDDEELINEIADMYLANRAFYYSGKVPQDPSVLSEKEIDVYVRFKDVNFSKLQEINV